MLTRFNANQMLGLARKMNGALMKLYSRIILDNVSSTAMLCDAHIVWVLCVVCYVFHSVLYRFNLFPDVWVPYLRKEIEAVQHTVTRMIAE